MNNDSAGEGIALAHYLPPHLHWQQRQLVMEGFSLVDLAKQHQTPCYVYSKTAILENFRAYQQALLHRDHLICYAVKANSNLSLLRLLAEAGAGFDIVSLGELERCLAAKVPSQRIIFSGVGKTAAEIERALSCGIYCFNVESRAELLLIAEVASQLKQVAAIGLRVNPDIDAKTHPYIATGMQEHKFGLDVAEALELAALTTASPDLNLIGLSCHIGSQLCELAPYAKACEKMLALVEQITAQGTELEFINMGGGLGINDSKPATSPPAIHELCQLMADKLPKLRILLEPGRSIVGPAGILLSRVIRIKQHGEKHFAVIDAAMNDYIRPALYQAWPIIMPTVLPDHAKTEVKPYDIVGPVCESADCFAKAQALSLAEGDIIAILNAGAYGFSMSSQYNSRPRPAEILIEQDQQQLIRPAETITELFAVEERLL